jgi:RHS repeat-associated protein
MKNKIGRNFLACAILGLTIFSPVLSFAAGELIYRANYTAFGELLSESGALAGAVDYTFTGQERDAALAMLDYDARFYNPRLGRFASLDPVDQHGESLYAYVHNNPLRYIDPTGQAGEETNKSFAPPLRQDIYIFDRSTASNQYQAKVYIVHYDSQGDSLAIHGPFAGNSRPSQKEAGGTNFNTVKETGLGNPLLYNNESGHKGGTQKGLNIIDENGDRVAPGTTPKGKDVEMNYVNVHSGGVNGIGYKKNHKAWSAGCNTVSPADTASFWSNFDFSKGKKGKSEGNYYIIRDIYLQPIATGLIKLTSPLNKPATTSTPVDKTATQQAPPPAGGKK